MADVQIAVIDQQDTQIALAVPGVQGPIGLTGSVTIAQAGTAATPGIRFESDTNTGIYSPGADQLAVSTAGTGRLFVDATGNVGVGTSPDARLTVQDGATIVARTKQLAFDNYTNEGIGTTFSRTSDGAEVVAIGVVDNDKLLMCSRPGLLFGTGGGGLYSAVSERMRITEEGLVGVGTSSPANRITAAGAEASVGIYNTTAGSTVSPSFCKLNFYGYLEDSTWNVASISASNSASNNYGGTLRFATNTEAGTHTTALTIDNQQRVGIGTTSPSSLLHLADAGNITVGTTTGTKIGTATTQKLGFYNATPVVQPAAVADATDARNRSLLS
jgi:hypothetical protein